MCARHRICRSFVAFSATPHTLGRIDLYEAQGPRETSGVKVSNLLISDPIFSDPVWIAEARGHVVSRLELDYRNRNRDSAGWATVAQSNDKTQPAGLRTMDHRSYVIRTPVGVNKLCTPPVDRETDLVLGVSTLLSRRR